MFSYYRSVDKNNMLRFFYYFFHLKSFLKRNAKLSNPVKLATDNTYSNSNLNYLNVELNDEEVYNLETSLRKVEILENLKITIGTQTFCKI